MSHHHHNAASPTIQEKSASRLRGAIAFAVFLAVALFFLLTEHRAHFFGFLPYLLILACPLMHLFHHHGHGGHDRHAHDAASVDPAPGKEL